MRGNEHPNPRSFALVIALFLVVVLATSAAGLAMSVRTESLHADARSAELRHELAVDSFVELLPQLMPAKTAEAPIAAANAPEKGIELSFGACKVKADLRRESKKLNVRQLDAASADRLRDLASTNGLPAKNVVLQPIAEVERSNLQLFWWFDQLIQQTEFEETFRWQSPQAAADSVIKATWSDLLTFWDAPSGERWGCEVETIVGDQSRRWYVVVELKGSVARILHRSRT